MVLVSDLFAEEGYEVRPITKQDAYWLILNVHYARRLPAISYAFGLFYSGDLKGVVTYGSPPSPTLVRGIAGDKWKDNVLELNRLVLVDNKPNEASRLVGGSLQLLPKPTIVVSFADTAQHHEGVIYQATNFFYTGLTAPRTEMAVEGMEHLHSKTLSDQVQGAESRVVALKEMYGDKFYYRQRSLKHRYIIIMASKTDKKQIMKDLRYLPQPYPKGYEDEHLGSNKSECQT